MSHVWPGNFLTTNDIILKIFLKKYFFWNNLYKVVEHESRLQGDHSTGLLHQSWNEKYPKGISHIHNMKWLIWYDIQPFWLWYEYKKQNPVWDTYTYVVHITLGMLCSDMSLSHVTWPIVCMRTIERVCKGMRERSVREMFLHLWIISYT